MADSGDLKKEKRSPEEESWRGMFWLSAFLLLEGAALCAVATWQQQSISHYSESLLTAETSLELLERSCGVVPPLDSFGQESYVEEDARQSNKTDGGDEESHSRGKRQTLSNLFHDLIIAQEHVLMEVCNRRTDLCQPGPKGQRGDQGDAGMAGGVGAKGETGDVGPQGKKGKEGPGGEAGVAGTQGPKGMPGDQGQIGVKGNTGAPGVKGAAGETGPKGQTGAVGPTGDQGDMGPAGAQGPDGEKGDTGPQGERGDAGAQGPPGEAGAPGSKGPLVENGCECYEMPTVTGNFTDTESVRLHHRLVLSCDVSGGQANIYWRKAGSSLPPTVKTEGNNLIIESATEAAKGTYECVAESATGNVIKSVDIELIEPSKNDCDFESGFCQWQNIRADRFDWILNKGSTSTANTGPTKDHTIGNSDGYYAYIETSSPRVHNDNARLESPTLQPSKPYCLSLWYHLYGHSLGNVNVRVKTNGIVQAPMWQESGPSEDQWHEARINIPPQNTPFSLIVEGVRGDNYYGDAAIDDLTLTEAAC